MHRSDVRQVARRYPVTVAVLTLVLAYFVLITVMRAVA